MARVKLEVPSTFSFQTTIPIRITDVNYGGHVGNDSILSILHEIRIQFLKKFLVSNPTQEFILNQIINENHSVSFFLK